MVLTPTKRPFSSPKSAFDAGLRAETTFLKSGVWERVAKQGDFEGKIFFAAPARDFCGVERSGVSPCPVLVLTFDKDFVPLKRQKKRIGSALTIKKVKARELGGDGLWAFLEADNGAPKI